MRPAGGARAQAPDTREAGVRRATRERRAPTLQATRPAFSGVGETHAAIAVDRPWLKRLSGQSASLPKGGTMIAMPAYHAP